MEHELSVVTLGTGHFLMMDILFRHIKGIEKVVSGYAYGSSKTNIVSRLDLEEHPLTYEPTKHFEVV